MPAFLTAAEAARRLGVKPATVYAYVSRGTLTRTRGADGRGSLFDADEIERLARRGRPRRPPGTLDITVESAITEITGDRLRYRGLDVVELAKTRAFEDIATLLWTGALPPATRSGPEARPGPDTRSGADTRSGPDTRSGSDARSGPAAGVAARTAWLAPAAALSVGQTAQSALPPETLPLERLQVIVPAMAATDPLRLHLDRPAVMAAARSIIAGMVDCLPAPPAQAGTEFTPTAPPCAESAPVAARLWARLCGRTPSRAMLRALSGALVLLADHELAASTLAARAAASVRADPYAVVATGLGAMSGALHGGASLGAETLLAAATGPADAPRVVGDVLRRGEKVPGFGHFVYRVADPRGLLLLDLVRRAAPKSRKLAVADAILAEVRRRSLPEPNIDFAIATLVASSGMVRGAGEAIFAVARTAGWIAHALEAYESGVPLRPRAAYTGPVYA
jgi:citrate synthase